jgi:hypothetical protein
MAPHASLDILITRLERSLERFEATTAEQACQFPQARQLAMTAAGLQAKFVEGKPAQPPSQARINALARLRRNDPTLNRRDWHLIAWGLCDDCGRAGKPIEDAEMVARVLSYLDNQNQCDGISRRFWFGLLHSYFAYAADNPADNPQWVDLRTRLAITATKLIASQQRLKAWAITLHDHLDLLTADAGARLAVVVIQGDTATAAALKNHLPIPDNSWLWQRVIAEQLRLLPSMGDDAFYPVIMPMLQLAIQHPHQTDKILAALLTRYEQSAAREQAHDELKQVALTHWQNPQIKLANRWVLVSDDVRKMVLQWFATADLQHFFSLLQGAGRVDKDRLDYWLRFVDQISFTRIVMGGDAFASQHPNFVDFREKNRGRFSALHGGDTANNAFIMRIGQYYFVEFSGKGNACYVYEEAQLPFNPESGSFTLTRLKHKEAATERIIHNGSWEWAADRSLRRLGIFPETKRVAKRTAAPVAMAPIATLPVTQSASLVAHSIAVAQTVASMQQNTAESSVMRPTRFGAVADALQRTSETQSNTMTTAANSHIGDIPSASASDSGMLGTSGKLTPGQAVRLAKELAGVKEAGFADYRVHGGAFWILEKNPASALAKQLAALGFKHREGRGHWIK